MKKFVPFLLSLFLLTGCMPDYTDLNMHSQESNLLYYQYLPVAQCLSGSWCSEEDLKSIDQAFQQKTAEYTAVFNLNSQPGKNQINTVLHDGYLQLWNYSPTAKVLYENRTAINSNPILTVTPMMKALERSSLNENRPSLTWNPEKASVYQEKTAFISGLMISIFPELTDCQIGYSETENLYYAYVLDFSSDMYILSFYFGFDQNDILVKDGIDYIICGGNELCPAVNPEYHKDCLSLDFNKSKLQSMYDMLFDAIGSCMDKTKLQKIASVKAVDKSYDYKTASAAEIITAYQGSTWFFLEFPETIPETIDKKS